MSLLIAVTPHDAGALSLRRLAYLLKVLEVGSIRGAAQTLDMDASAVSRAISMMEEEIGAALLQRHGRGVIATEIGELVAGYARRQLLQQGHLLEQIRSIQAAAQGHVELVAGEGFVDWLAEDVLWDMLSDRPGVTVNLTVASSDEIIARVTDEQADLGLIFLPPENAWIRSHVTVRNAIQILVHADHPLTQLGRPVRLADLVSYRGVLLQQAHGVRQIVRQAELSEGVRLSGTMTTNSFHAMHLFALRGTGYAFTASPLRTLAERSGPGRAVLLPTASPILQRGTVHLISKHGRTLSPSAWLICNGLREKLAALT